MKLLFDANLSPALVSLLADLFPGSRHVFTCGNIARDDLLVWEFAQKNDLMIVSKDSDFHRMSFVLGAPPKVIWVRVGNAPTSGIEAVLRANWNAVQRFAGDADAAFLVVAL